MTEQVKAFKGFDENWQCRGFQFAVGQTYTHKGPVKACEGGFHACEYPLDVFAYYSPGKSRYAVVLLDGETSTHEDDTKIAGARITIEAELTVPQLVKSSTDWIMGQIKSDAKAHSTDDYSAATNTGDYSAATNTGYRSAATNTGYRSAATNTGNQSAATNTGYQSAATNTGYQSAACVEGAHSVAMASGYQSRAKACEGSAIVLVYRDDDMNLIHIRAGIAGRDVEADVWYRLDAQGEFVQD